MKLEYRKIISQIHFDKDDGHKCSALQSNFHYWKFIFRKSLWLFSVEPYSNITEYRVKFDHRRNIRFSTFHHHPTHMRRMYFAFCLYLRCVSLINKMFYLWTCCNNKQAERVYWRGGFNAKTNQFDKSFI